MRSDKGRTAIAHQAGDSESKSGAIFSGILEKHPFQVRGVGLLCRVDDHLDAGFVDVGLPKADESPVWERDGPGKENESKLELVGSRWGGHQPLFLP